jgi:hypothetical protein
MTVRRIGRYVVTSKPGHVYLIDEASAADSDMTIDQAISLSEAIQLAAHEASRFTPRPTRLWDPAEPVCGCAGAGRWDDLSDDSRREDQ